MEIARRAKKTSKKGKFPGSNIRLVLLIYAITSGYLEALGSCRALRSEHFFGGFPSSAPSACTVTWRRASSRRRRSAAGLGLGLAKLGKLAKFANFWRARSRLYRNEILQEKMRLTAFFKLYKICILLHRCNLKILEKHRFEKSAISVNIQQNFCIFFLKE